MSPTTGQPQRVQPPDKPQRFANSDFYASGLACAEKKFGWQSSFLLAWSFALTHAKTENRPGRLRAMPTPFLPRAALLRRLVVPLHKGPGEEVKVNLRADLRTRTRVPEMTECSESTPINVGIVGLGWPG